MIIKDYSRTILVRKEVPNKVKDFLREKSVEILVGIVLTIISVFIIGRIDKFDDRQRLIEIDIASIKTTLESFSENQGTLLGNDGDNRVDLKLLNFRLTAVEKAIEK